eukprot:CAMPEP_0184663258 /NCGR_PEP_ID=MMETSP0308-20130426/47297_1 /TAXON_ID=38269 /ORGANISM="Gloeochaete witrockiana, Strain SAG 46.84" /LENGTH=220 /DNA_ID=CAMNT_0027105863 /DNA_START=113 /DNA_END=772 /DNA_ORIENTATION=-
MNFPKVIGLNVGGSVFLTSLATLSQSNFLGSMFSGRFSPESLEKDRDGNYFIDRDGTHFRYVLNFLRDGVVTLPSLPSHRKELLSEAEFYQVTPLINALKQEFSKHEQSYPVYEHVAIRIAPEDFKGPNVIAGPVEYTAVCEISRAATAATKCCNLPNPDYLLLRDKDEEGLDDGGGPAALEDAHLHQVPVEDADGRAKACSCFPENWGQIGVFGKDGHW